jgi:hypothetical protein
MNPLLWRREQQIALAIASGTGVAIGLIYGVSTASPIFGYRNCMSLVAWLLHDVCRSSLFPHHWLGLLGWPIFGALLGAAVIYIWKMMQASGSN